MYYLEAEVRPNEKDQFLKDLKEANYRVRKSNPHEKVYVKEFDPFDFGWVEFVGTENGEWTSRMCILAMFHGCYKPVRIVNVNIGKELDGLRSLIIKTETMIKKYPDRLSLISDLQGLKMKEQELVKELK